MATKKKSSLTNLVFAAALAITLPVTVFLVKTQIIDIRQQASQSATFGKAIKLVKANKGFLSAPPILPTDILTFEAWVKFDDFTPESGSTISYPSTLFTQGRGSCTFDVSLYVHPNMYAYNGKAGDLQATFCDSSASFKYINVANQPITTNTWHHVAFTKDGSVARIFLDGKLVGSLTYTGPVTYINSPQILSIGAANYVSHLPVSNGFFGEMDEVRISNVARYTSDFTPSRTVFQTDSNTLALYHFDDNYFDTSGNANNAIPFGNVQFVDSTIVIPSPTVRQTLCDQKCPGQNKKFVCFDTISRRYSCTDTNDVLPNTRCTSCNVSGRQPPMPTKAVPLPSRPPILRR